VVVFHPILPVAESKPIPTVFIRKSTPLGQNRNYLRQCFQACELSAHVAVLKSAMQLVEEFYLQSSCVLKTNN